MENISIQGESIIKLVMFVSGILGSYFWIRNSIAILNERQDNMKEDIDELMNCSNSQEQNMHKIDNRLTRCETCVNAIKREIDGMKK